MLVISISSGSGCINTLSTSLSYGSRHATPAIARRIADWVIDSFNNRRRGVGCYFHDKYNCVFSVAVGRCSVSGLDWCVQTDVAEDAVGL